LERSSGIGCTTQYVRPVGCSCRAGSSGASKPWKAGIDHPCMAADIEKTAGLTVHEPDDNVVHFARWRPFDQNAACRSAFSGPAYVTMGTADTIAALPSDRRAMPAPANEVSNAWGFYWTLEIGTALIQVEQVIRLAVRMQAIQSGVDPISSSRAAAGTAERETAF
jgi:hypothetical protein